MLKALKFVKGAVSKKDYQPALTHFRIKDGRITGYNGTIALSSPIALDIDAAPKAEAFVKAIERCESETTTLTVTPNGRIFIRSGRFKAHIECTDDVEILDRIQPEGREVPIDGDIVAACKALEPYIGTDASRPWATGVLLRQYSAYATNNIIVAEYWIGQGLPDVCLPSQAIDELLRIGEQPTKVLIAPNNMTFFFGERWLRVQLLNADWPDVSPLLNQEGAELQSFPEGFFEALDLLKPFVGEEGHVFFRDGYISTSALEGEGASVDINGLPKTGAFNLQYLRSLEGRVAQIDFSKKPPVPCPFYGDNLRGVILPMYDQ